MDNQVLELIKDDLKEIKSDIKELKKGQQDILLARAEEKGKMKVIAAIVSACVSGIAIATYSVKDHIFRMFS